MRRVYLESPYAGNVERNVRYARACMLDCLRRGESAYASHLLMTQILDDLEPDERTLGIEAGFAWAAVAEATVVYTDLGESLGMSLGIQNAHLKGRPIEYRKLPADLWRLVDVSRTADTIPPEPTTQDLTDLAADDLGEDEIDGPEPVAANGATP